MMKRLWPLLLLLAACARYPVRNELTIEPERESDTVVATVSTSFSLEDLDDEVVRTTVENARSNALAGNDPWSIRFGRLSSPDEDRVTYQRKRGTLERVTRSARIPSDDLQQLFSDTNITVHVLRGEGWRELSFYPGSGGRASREQQRDFDTALTNWSEVVADYFRAIDRLYAYLRVNPHRDNEVFAALADKEVPLPEEEQALVEDVLKAMENIGERMDHYEGSAMNFLEAADLIFNPFPAKVTIQPPGDVLESEGFTNKDRTLVIEQVDLFAAIGELEGRWISPDPLAALLRDTTTDPQELAALPRKSTAVVSGAEVARAIREKLQRPRMYRVRWRD